MLLPKPCAFMSGCVLDDVIYISGGIETPTATSAMNTFWSLHLKKLGTHWQELPPCPGKPRILACMAAAYDLQATQGLLRFTTAANDAAALPVGLA